MNDIEQKRAFVQALYPGPGWKRKVKQMSDSQVLAIYMREKDKPKKTSPKKQDPKPQKESGQDGIPF